MIATREYESTRVVHSGDISYWDLPEHVTPVTRAISTIPKLTHAIEQLHTVT